MQKVLTGNRVLHKIQLVHWNSHSKEKPRYLQIWSWDPDDAPPSVAE